MLQSRKKNREMETQPSQTFFFSLLFLFGRMQSHPNFYYEKHFVGWALSWSEMRREVEQEVGVQLQHLRRDRNTATAQVW